MRVTTSPRKGITQKLVDALPLVSVSNDQRSRAQPGMSSKALAPIGGRNAAECASLLASRRAWVGDVIYIDRQWYRCVPTGQNLAVIEGKRAKRQTQKVRSIPPTDSAREKAGPRVYCATGAYVPPQTITRAGALDYRAIPSRFGD